MAEPTSSSAAAIAASISGVTLALFGVEWHALLWGFVGALFSMAAASGMSTGRAIIYVALSTLVGSALGHAVLEVFDTTKPAILIVASLAGGAGAQQIVSRIIEAVSKRIDKLGGGA